MEKQSKFLLRLLLVITSESTCQSVRPAMRRPGVKAAACWSQVQRPNHYSTGTQPVNVLILRSNIRGHWCSLCSQPSAPVSRSTPPQQYHPHYSSTHSAAYIYT